MSFVAKFVSFSVLSAAVAIFSIAARAGDRLPEGAKTLREIVTSLEQSGYKFVEASIDNRRWEFDVYQGDVSYELRVDPKTGQVLSQHRDDADPAPPAQALPLSSILEALEAAGLTSIVEVEFEHGRWEIDAYRNQAKRELRVDPFNGSILEDRADD